MRGRGSGSELAVAVWSMGREGQCRAAAPLQVCCCPRGTTIAMASFFLLVHHLSLSVIRSAEQGDGVLLSRRSCPETLPCVCRFSAAAKEEVQAASSSGKGTERRSSKKRKKQDANDRRHAGLVKMIAQ
jgi:hypothetical protein